MSEELKTKGNEYFVANDFTSAEDCYTRALEQFEDNKVILFTNRSAARLALNKFEEALADSEQAISLDPTWTKAYYRKCSALQKLERHRDCFKTWMQAAASCEGSAWLTKQLTTATQAWRKIFKTVPVDSDDDLMERYGLLVDNRERLSTMAHFWNDSTEEERFHHFQFLLSVIGGEGELSEQNKRFTADMMHPMPLHNYEDLPRAAIAPWCDYFHRQPLEGKTALFNRIWSNLSELEQDAVISDLKIFIARAYEMSQLLASPAATAAAAAASAVDELD